MSTPRNKTKNAKKHLLVGTWASKDIFVEDVKYIVSAQGKKFSVRVIDHADHEEADVFEIKWDKQKEILSFVKRVNPIFIIKRIDDGWSLF